MKKIEVLTAFLLTFITSFVTQNATAQPSFLFNAFAPCLDAGGQESLCAQNSWAIAEGFSPEENSQSSSLAQQFFTVESGREACADSSIPASINISLGKLTPSIGDKIYFEDLIIEVAGEDGEFLPSLPIHVSALSQDGMLLTEPHWEYIEVASFGHAMLIVNFYCNQLSEVYGRFNFTVPR